MAVGSVFPEGLSLSPGCGPALPLTPTPMATGSQLCKHSVMFTLVLGCVEGCVPAESCRRPGAGARGGVQAVWGVMRWGDTPSVLTSGLQSFLRALGYELLLFRKRTNDELHSQLVSRLVV